MIPFTELKQLVYQTNTTCTELEYTATAAINNLKDNLVSNFLKSGILLVLTPCIELSLTGTKEWHGSGITVVVDKNYGDIRSWRTTMVW